MKFGFTRLDLILGMAAFGYVALAAYFLLDPLELWSAALLAIPVAVVGMWLVMQATEAKPWPTALLLIAVFFFTEATFRHRLYEDKGVDLQTFVRLLLWSLFGLLALMRLPRYRHVLFSSAVLAWLPFYALMVVSVAWTQDPLFAAVAVLSFLVIHLGLICVATEFETESIVVLMFAAAGALCLGSIAAYFAAPDFGRMVEWVGNTPIASNRMRGITPSANAIGGVSAAAIVLAGLYWRALVSRLGVFFVSTGLAAALVCMVLGQNRMTLAASAVVLALWHFWNPRRSYVLLLAGAFFILLTLVAVTWTDDPLALLSRSGESREITTATGRSYIWAVVLELWKKKPLFGWGYSSMIFILPERQDLFRQAAHAHNLYLEVLVSLGLVGIVAFLFALGTTLVSAVALRESRAICIVAFTLLRGLAEAHPFTGVASFAFIFFAAGHAFIAVRGAEAAARERRTDPIFNGHHRGAIPCNAPTQPVSTTRR